MMVTRDTSYAPGPALREMSDEALLPQVRAVDVFAEVDQIKKSELFSP